MNRTVIAVVDDMFFASKIRAVAEAVGAEITFPRSIEALLEKAKGAQLILVDLHHQKVDPLALARAVKSDEQTLGVPLVGSFHMLRRSCKETHWTRVTIESCRAQHFRETCRSF
jgi:CheY-like chemotaxis protein